jgi:hypothetical protein
MPQLGFVVANAIAGGKADGKDQREDQYIKHSRSLPRRGGINHSPKRVTRPLKRLLLPRHVGRFRVLDRGRATYAAGARPSASRQPLDPER